MVEDAIAGNCDLELMEAVYLEQALEVFGMLVDGLDDGERVESEDDGLGLEANVELEEAIDFVDFHSMKVNILDDGLRILQSPSL